MKNTTIKEKPLLQSAIEILLRELGPQKAIKFWQVLSFPKMDYLSIRHKLFKRKSLVKLYKEAKKFNR